MSEISIDFEMTDALISQAVREDCVAFARDHVTFRDILAVLASTVVFALTVRHESHWLWWIAGLPLVIFVILSIAWSLSYLWFPRVAKSRLAHLPNRHVQFKASETTLSFVTATERLDVAWSELKALKRRPSFWIVYLRSGTRIPIPSDLVTTEAVSILKARLSPTAS